MGNPCVSHSITEPQIDDNYELLCRLWSPLVRAEEGGGCRPLSPVALKELTWQDINTALHSTCPLILSVFDIILSIPATNVDYERGFSTMRQVKTDWRSKLHIITLNDYMRISLEGPSIANFNPTNAIHN